MLRYISDVVPKDFVATTTIETTDDLYSNYSEISYRITKVNIHYFQNTKNAILSLETSVNDEARKRLSYEINIDKVFIFKDDKICETIAVNKTYYGLETIEIPLDNTKCGFSLQENHTFKSYVIAEIKEATFNDKGYLEGTYYYSSKP